MAAIPEANITILDGALGLVPGSSSNVAACLGVCSSGTINTVLSFGAGNVQAIKDALGTGPLVEQLCLLAQAGAPVMAVKVNTTTPGSAPVPTKTGAVGATVMTLTGTPLDAYELKVVVTRGSALPTDNGAAIKVSLDGGLTYGPEVALPTAGQYVVPGTGLTLVFSAATVGLGDFWTSLCVAPGFSTTDLNTAIDALTADPREWFLLNVVGVPPDAATMAAVFSAVESKMQTAASLFRFARALISAADLADAALITQFASMSGTRTGVAAGMLRLISPVSGQQIKRSAAFMVAKRLVSIPPSEDAGRVATGPAGAEITTLLRDEWRTPALDQLGVSTLRTHIGLPGSYVTSARLKASPTSDFQFFQHGRVMDLAAKATRLSVLQFLNDSVQVNKTTGLILESEARRIESYVEGAVRSVVTRPGYASNVSVAVGRVNNILSDQTLYVTVRVIPLGYVRAISATIGFFNPALQPS